MLNITIGADPKSTPNSADPGSDRRIGSGRSPRIKRGPPLPPQPVGLAGGSRAEAFGEGKELSLRLVLRSDRDT